jgi:FAD synthase
MDRIGLGSKQLAVFDAIHCGHNEFFAHELSEDNVDLNVLDWRKRS